MKHVRKLTSWLLTIALILTLLPVVAIRARAAWSGSGDGTLQNPYQIDSKEKLEKFRNIVNGTNGESKNPAAWAVLTANIDLEGSDTNKWTPIGKVETSVTEATGYTGTFDGQGHSITGLYVSGERYFGLFGQIGAGETVRNVSVSGNVTDSGTYVGGIAGANYGTVVNCYNACTVKGTYDVGGALAITDPTER